MKTKLKKSISILIICFLIGIPNFSQANIKELTTQEVITIASDDSNQKGKRPTGDSEIITNPSTSTEDNQGGKREPAESSGIHTNPGSSTINPDQYKPGATDDEISTTVAQKAGVIMNWIFVLGIIISVITLVIIGIKYMLGSVSEKAEYKKTMVPYLVGVFMVAGTSMIVKLIASIIMPLIESF